VYYAGDVREICVRALGLWPLMASILFEEIAAAAQNTTASASAELPIL
jgi:hypothetical protein